MNVLTSKGLLDMADLDVKPVIEFGDNHCKVAIEYRLHGEIVKRSVHIDILRPIQAEPTLGSL